MAKGVVRTLSKNNVARYTGLCFKIRYAFKLRHKETFLLRLQVNEETFESYRGTAEFKVPSRFISSRIISAAWV